MRKEASTRPSPILCSIYFPPAEDKLKEAGVDEHIILAMIDASYNSNAR